MYAIDPKPRSREFEVLGSRIDDYGITIRPLEILTV